jgi:hypothetical protein
MDVSLDAVSKRQSVSPGNHWRLEMNLLISGAHLAACSAPSLLPSCTRSVLVYFSAPGAWAPPAQRVRVLGETSPSMFSNSIIQFSSSFPGEKKEQSVQQTGSLLFLLSLRLCLRGLLYVPMRSASRPFDSVHWRVAHLESRWVHLVQT